MKENKPKQIAFGIAVFILTLFVTIYGLNTFFERPTYEDYCGQVQPKEIVTQTECEANEGKWTTFVGPKGDEGYCDTTFYCREELESANKNFAKKVFLIAMPLSLLIIVLGAFFFKINSVGTGLMLGGVGTILYGTGSYWSYASNPLKFILSLIGLTILIWLAYRIEKKSITKRKR